MSHLKECKFERPVERTVRGQYLLHLPSDYEANPDKSYPMILFLHGLGECGDDLNQVKVHGVIKIAEENPDFPFIVCAPQCPQFEFWNVFYLNGLLDEILEEYRVDTDRVYLTGLSMGGFGTWALACDASDRFAAAAPICGGGYWLLAPGAKKLPIWAFHGEDDVVVPISRSEEMVEAVQNAGGNVRFTRYPGVDHDSWTQTYNNPELYEWFLSHKRSDRD